MDFFLFLLFVIYAILYYSLKKKHKRLGQEFKDVSSKNTELTADKNRLEQEVATLNYLAKYKGLIDIEAQANQLLKDANDEADSMRNSAKLALQEARSKAQVIIQNAESRLREAQERYSSIISDAEKQALEIGGDAYRALKEVDELRRTAAAMKNTIAGYGDQYVMPHYGLLDELAEEFGYEEAGQKLKEAREYTKFLIKEQRAATCSYVATDRRETAIAFVLDAFNGKVDTILSKTKLGNFGTLSQSIKDAFALVNHNGKAFREAAITQEYLDARLQELKWAIVVHELKNKQIEEQRALRERMREEEKARREYEKAMKEAQKQEETYRKAMEKARAELEKASESERAHYEAKILEIEAKLKEAEEKNQRAKSMAELTRAGNVYVISNIGAFGENIYKVGLTRRLDPTDRVRELGDASVPFPYDIHAVIYSEDAPKLEHELHRALALQQLNKVNPRKEFFRVGLQQIRELVESKGFKASWTMTAEAAEYRETLAIEAEIEANPAKRAEWERRIAAAVAVADKEDLMSEVAVASQ